MHLNRLVAGMSENDWGRLFWFLLLLRLLRLGLLDDLHGDEEDQEHDGREHHAVVDALAVLTGGAVDIEPVCLDVVYQLNLTPDVDVADADLPADKGQGEEVEKLLGLGVCKVNRDPVRVDVLHGRGAQQHARLLHKHLHELEVGAPHLLLAVRQCDLRAGFFDCELLESRPDVAAVSDPELGRGGALGAG